MRVLYYDCFAGISGDMNMAALLELGVDKTMLRTELEKLGLSDTFELQVKRDSKHGIFGTRVDVVLHSHHHDHHHDHHHHHSHSHAPHRNLSDITKIISNSALSQAVKTSALNIFKRIAEAEASVHHCGIDEIHFHEVGATDAIVDIVGACICIHSLGVDKIMASSIELGGGFVKCAHGVMPVPAPATVRILHNLPTRQGGTQHEATTPTGAAILAEFVDEFSDTPSLTTEKTAYGIGHRDMEKPNILRVQLAQTTQSLNKSEARLLECTIDDMTGEAISFAMEQLFEAGADDVNLIPVIMKKSRPGTIISVLCSADKEHKIQQVLFRETTTLGVKSTNITKTTLERRSVTHTTSYGDITFKEAIQEGKTIRAKAEFEECAAIARKKNIPLEQVYSTISNTAGS